MYYHFFHVLNPYWFHVQHWELIQAVQARISIIGTPIAIWVALYLWITQFKISKKQNAMMDKQMKLWALQSNINTLTQEIWNANAYRMHLSDMYRDACKFENSFIDSKPRDAVKKEINELDEKTEGYIKLRNETINKYNEELNS